MKHLNIAQLKELTQNKLDSHIKRIEYYILSNQERFKLNRVNQLREDLDMAKKFKTNKI